MVPSELSVTDETKSRTSTLTDAHNASTTAVGMLDDSCNSFPLDLDHSNYNTKSCCTLELREDPCEAFTVEFVEDFTPFTVRFLPTPKTALSIAEDPCESFGAEIFGNDDGIDYFNLTPGQYCNYYVANSVMKQSYCDSSVAAVSDNEDSDGFHGFTYSTDELDHSVAMIESCFYEQNIFGYAADFGPSSSRQSQIRRYKKTRSVRKRSRNKKT